MATIKSDSKIEFSLCRADELTRRKMMSSSSKSSPRKISPSLKQTSAVATPDPDPGQLLNEWLGELDNLQKVSLKIWKKKNSAKIPHLNSD